MYQTIIRLLVGFFSKVHIKLQLYFSELFKISIITSVKGYFERQHLLVCSQIMKHEKPKLALVVPHVMV